MVGLRRGRTDAFESGRGLPQSKTQARKARFLLAPDIASTFAKAMVDRPGSGRFMPNANVTLDPIWGNDGFRSFPMISNQFQSLF